MGRGTRKKYRIAFSAFYGARGRYLYANIICEKWETYDYDEIYS